MYGVFDKRLSDWVTESEVGNLEQLKNVYEAGFAVAREKDPGCPDELYLDFFPQPRSEVPAFKFVLATLPGQISMSYAWDFNVHDLRRKSVEVGGILTGIDVKNLLVPGQPGTADRTSRLVAIYACGGEVADDDDDEVLADEGDRDFQRPENNSLIDYSVTMVDGWRLSYRKMTPEVPDEKMHASILGKRYRAMAPVRNKFHVATRNVPFAQKYARARNLANARNDRERAKAKKLKEYHARV